MKLDKASRASVLVLQLSAQASVWDALVALRWRPWLVSLKWLVIIRTNMIIAAALVEGVALFGAIICLLVALG